MSEKQSVEQTVRGIRRKMRKKYERLNTTQVKKLKALEKGNAYLKNLAAGLSLDNAILNGF